MDQLFQWIGNHTQFFGFVVATLIFLFTVFLASRGLIGFFITLLFLLFSLVTGFMIANHDVIRGYLQAKNEEVKNDPDGTLSAFKQEMLDKYNNMKREWNTEKSKFQKHLDETSEEKAPASSADAE